MEHTSRRALCAALVALLAVALGAPAAHAQRPVEHTAMLTGGGAAEAGHWVDQVTAYMQAIHDEAMRQIVEYVTAVQEQQVRDAIAAEQAQEATDRAEAARMAAVANNARVTPPASSGSGSCYGGPVPDYIVTRESGGNPQVFNSGGSGAYGCFQIMPGTWNSAANHCGDIAPYGNATADQQKQCAARLVANSGLSPWGG